MNLTLYSSPFFRESRLRLAIGAYIMATEA
jgi:hypothetical protein